LLETKVSKLKIEQLLLQPRHRLLFVLILLSWIHLCRNNPFIPIPILMPDWAGGFNGVVPGDNTRPFFCFLSIPFLGGTGGVTRTDDGVLMGDVTGIDTGALTGIDTGALTGIDTGALTGIDTGALTGIDNGASTGSDTGGFTGIDTGAASGIDAGAFTGIDTGTLSGGKTGDNTGVVLGDVAGADTRTGAVTGTCKGAGTDAGTGAGAETGTGGMITLSVLVNRPHDTLVPLFECTTNARFSKFPTTPVSTHPVK
jgi:hypothetical protein